VPDRGVEHASRLFEHTEIAEDIGIAPLPREEVLEVCNGLIHVAEASAGQGERVPRRGELAIKLERLVEGRLCLPKLSLSPPCKPRIPANRARSAQARPRSCELLQRARVPSSRGLDHTEIVAANSEVGLEIYDALEQLFCAIPKALNPEEGRQAGAGVGLAFIRLDRLFVLVAKSTDAPQEEPLPEARQQACGATADGPPGRAGHTSEGKAGDST
jgi:hypothetical protein